jgi:hypothetical protein
MTTVDGHPAWCERHRLPPWHPHTAVLGVVRLCSGKTLHIGLAQEDGMDGPCVRAELVDDPDAVDDANDSWGMFDIPADAARRLAALVVASADALDAHARHSGP